VLFGLSLFYLVRAELKKTRELGKQLLNLAQGVGDPALLLEAHERLGIASFFLGEPTIALEHWDEGVALYDPERQCSHAFVPGQYSGVVCLGWAGVALWHLGYPAQALKRSNEALALARKIAHPFTVAGALFSAAWIHALRGEWPMAAEYAEATIVISAEQGFADWLLLGTFYRGLALAGQGRTDEGIAQMRDALAAMPTIGFELARPYYLAVLAAASGKPGRTDDALALLAEALAVGEKRDERIWEAELYRLKGEPAFRVRAFIQSGCLFPTRH
jgi:predicted ATPase